MLRRNTAWSPKYRRSAWHITKTEQIDTRTTAKFISPWRLLDWTLVRAFRIPLKLITSLWFNDSTHLSIVYNYIGLKSTHTKPILILLTCRSDNWKLQVLELGWSWVSRLGGKENLMCTTKCNLESNDARLHRKPSLSHCYNWPELENDMLYWSKKQGFSGIIRL